MMIDSFYISYHILQHPVPRCGSRSTQEQYQPTHEQKSCFDRLNNLLSSAQIRGVIDFSVVYARSRRLIGSPKGGLSVTSIAKPLGLTILQEESRVDWGYILLNGPDTTISVTSFASWGATTQETLSLLIKAIRQRNIRYVFIRWPNHTLEVGQEVIRFVFPVPPGFSERGMGNSDLIVRWLAQKEETSQYILSLWPDFEEQMSDDRIYFSVGQTFIL